MRPRSGHRDRHSDLGCCCALCFLGMRSPTAHPCHLIRGARALDGPCPAQHGLPAPSPPLPQLQKTPLPCAASPADLVGSEQEEQEGGLEGAAVCVQPGAAAGRVTWSTGGDCLPHGGSGVSECGPGLVGAGGSDLVGAGGPHLVGTGGPDLVGAGGPGLEGMEGPDLVGAGAPDLVGAGGRNLTWWEQVDLTWWEWGA